MRLLWLQALLALIYTVSSCLIRKVCLPTDGEVEEIFLPYEVSVLIN